MVKTECFKSWFRCCGTIVLATFFALNSTSALAKTIYAGETVSGAEGTEDNLLNIHGTVIDTIINSGSHILNKGGTAYNTIINSGIIKGVSGSTIDGLTINEKGSFDFNTGITLTNANIYGQNASIINKVANDFVLNNDSKLTVSNGGIANNTTVNGGTIKGASGSIIDGLTINEKGSFDFDTGMTLTNANIYGQNASIINKVANDFVLNNDSKLTISSKGKAYNITVNGGTIKGASSSTIDGLTINENGIFDFDTGMTLTNANIYGQNVSIINKIANDFVLNNDSKLTISSKGKAYNITVNGGTIKGASSSTIDGLTINEKGSFNFNTDMTLTNANIYRQNVSIINKIANDFVLNNDSKLTVSNGGIANNTTVNDDGKLIVNNGGTANNTTVNGGAIEGSSGSIIDGLTINEKGSFDFNTGITLTNANIYGQNASIINKVANDFVLNNNSKFTLNEGGKANNTTINSGSFYVNNGSVANNTIINGGEITVDYEGTTNNIVINNGNLYLIGAATDITVNGGLIRGYSTYTIINNLTINENGIFDFNTGMTLTNANIYGQNVSIINKIANDFVLNNDSKLTVSNGGIANNTMVNDDGKLIVNNGGTANNTTVNGGTIKGASSSTIDGLTINEKGSFNFNTDMTLTNGIQEDKEISILDGVAKGFKVTTESVLNVLKDHKAIDIMVEKGGNLITSINSTVENLIAKAESILSIDENTKLIGNIIIDKLADISGSTYDFSKIFNDSNSEANSLTVVGGVNEAFTDKLVNEDVSKDKGLTLEGGEYSIANIIKEGSTQVAGWDVINIKATESAPATIVKLESDIELVGNNKDMTIGEGAVLDVSGHSPLEITIDGNVTNQGTMDFTIYDNDGEADDIVTIVGDYRASPGALIVLNIEPEKDIADKLVVQGDVIGNTNVFLKSNSEKSTEAEILFADVANDLEETASSFDIWRVEGSSFDWDAKKEDNKWYAYISDLPVIPEPEPEPEPEPKPENKPEAEKPSNPSSIRKLVPEMIAYMGLYDAGFEQTASLNKTIANNIAKNQLLGRNCRNGKCTDVKMAHSAWVVPNHQNLKIKAPYKYEAKISGLDAGIDIDGNGINKWGVLASYRHGNYEFDGKGKKYYSDKGSEIDIDSYLLGLYFRRDKYNTKFAGAVYGGIQKAEITSDDGVKAKTDALEIGATLDIAHVYNIAKNINIIPELQVSYQMLSYDNIKDNAGKEIKPETAHRITAEAGVKVEKQWSLDEGKAAIYMKPSVIQTLHGGGKLNFADLDSIHSNEDRTLGRLEIGGNYEVNARWSIGASAAHTFGSDYNDTSFNLDAKYRF